MKKITTLLTLVAFCVPALAQAAHYEIDPDHSSVNFKIRHLLSKTQGKFEKFKGSFDYDPKNPKAWKVTATIDPNSVNTSNTKRDNHLRSPDFFDVKKFPTITFEGKDVKDASDKSAKVEGTLTMHGVSKPVVLDLEISGEGKDPWGNMRSGFTATTKLNRKDFGISWNKALDTGGVMLGEDVDVTIEVEGLAKK